MSFHDWSPCLRKPRDVGILSVGRDMAHTLKQIKKLRVLVCDLMFLLINILQLKLWSEVVVNN